MVLNNTPQGWNELHTLCYNDDAPGLVKYLKTKPNTNIIFGTTGNDYDDNGNIIPNGSNALHIALRKNARNVAMVLLEKGETKELAKQPADFYGNSIYHLCNRVDIVDKMARIDNSQHKWKNIHGENPLHVCTDPKTSMRIYDRYTVLAEQKDLSDDKQRPYDKIMQDTKNVKMEYEQLVKDAKNVEMQDEKSQERLKIAQEKKIKQYKKLKLLCNTAILQLFLNDCRSKNDACGAGIVEPSKFTTITSRLGNSMLHYASRIGDLDMLKHLSTQIDPRIGNRDGLTPLGEAINSNEGDMKDNNHKTEVINFLYKTARSNYLKDKGKMANAMPYIKAAFPLLDIVTDAVFVSELYSEESAAQFSANTLLTWKVLSIGFIILPILVYLVHFIRNLRNKYTTRAWHYALIPTYPIIDEFIPLSKRNASGYIEVIYEALPQMLIQTQIAFFLFFAKDKSSISFFISMSFSLIALMVKLPKQIYRHENIITMQVGMCKWASMNNMIASRIILSLEFLANGLTLVLVASMIVYQSSVGLFIAFVGIVGIDKLFRFYTSFKIGRSSTKDNEEEKLSVDDESEDEDDFPLKKKLHQEEKIQEDKVQDRDGIDLEDNISSYDDEIIKSKDSVFFVFIMSILVEAFTSKIIFNSRFNILNQKHNAKYFSLNYFTFSKIILYGVSIAVLQSAVLSEKVQFYLMTILCATELTRLVFYSMTKRFLNAKQ